MTHFRNQSCQHICVADMDGKCITSDEAATGVEVGKCEGSITADERAGLRERTVFAAPWVEVGESEGLITFTCHETDESSRQCESNLT